MSDKNNSDRRDEIHLFSLIDVIGNTRDSLVNGLYDFFNFIVKSWFILLILIIVGLVAGYFTDKSTVQRYETEILVRINYYGAKYVENAIENIERSAREGNKDFLMSIDLWDQGPLITDVEITPENDLLNIVESYPEENETLETIIKNVEVNDENTVSSIFFRDSKYFRLNFNLSIKANDATIERLMAYLNENEELEKIKIEKIKSLKEEIDENEEIISQIDAIVTSYVSNNDTGSVNPLIVDKDLTGLLDRKAEARYEISNLKIELLYAKDIVVVINRPEILKLKTSILSKKIILFPLVFIATFFFLTLIFRFYQGMKKRRQVLLE